MNEIYVKPLMEVSDWLLFKNSVGLKCSNLTEMMSIKRTDEFHKEHVKQMKSTIEHLNQTLDIIYSSLDDMMMEIRSIENLQLQIDLGDAGEDEIAYYEKREGRD